MKKCAYCKTVNREEAIFCSHCRRPLQPRQTLKDLGSRNLLIWVLTIVVLVGLSVSLFSSRLFSTQTQIPASTILEGAPVTGLAPTRTQEPVTLNECVENNTIRIRRGPGTHYETIGGLIPGACLTILGRNDEASWVYVVSDDHQTGWVDASLLGDAGDLSQVSVRDYSAIVNAARPTLTGAELAHGAQVYLTNVAATNIPQFPLTRYMLPCFQTADRIGDHISCRMEKAYCDYLPSVEGSPTICSDRPAPDQTFSLIVFDADWSDFDGQCLIVEGYLQISRGALQVQALQRSQVSPCD